MGGMAGYLLFEVNNTLHSKWPNWSNYRADSCVIIEISKGMLPPLLGEGQKSA